MARRKQRAKPKRNRTSELKNQARIKANNDVLKKLGI